MRSKTLVLIFVALGAGLVASIGISQAITKSDKSPEESTSGQIFVAATEINIGDRLNSQNVKLEVWPKSKIPEGAITKFEDLEDQTANQRLYSGEAILTAKLGGVNDLPRKIPRGYRAVPVKLNVDTVIGLIRPGDRVDVLVFLKKSREVPRTGTRTILRNIRVFAVNKNTERISDAEGKSFSAKTVSLLVKPSQVETLMLAKEMGKLQLSLRRPEDDPTDRAGSGTSIEKLLGSAPTSDDEKSQQKNPVASAAGGFLNWLRNNDKEDAKLLTQGKTADPKSSGKAALNTAATSTPLDESDVKFKMVVHGPGGSTEYRWRDEEKLPEAINVAGGGAAFNPAPSTDTDTGLSDSASSADEADSKNETKTKAGE